MRKFLIAKIIGFILIALGLAVMIGWIADISILKSLLPNLPNVNFMGATSLVLSGVLLFFITLSFQKHTASIQIVLSMCSIFILFLTLMFLISELFNVRLGMGDLFVEDILDEGEIATRARASIAGLLIMLLTAVAGIWAMVEANALKLKLQVIGWILAVIGMVSLIGHIVGVPQLYFSIEGFSRGFIVQGTVPIVLFCAGLIVLTRGGER